MLSGHIQGHASYYRCPACGQGWATTDKAPACPACGGTKRRRLPSVTTVLNNIGWKTDALKKWAWRLGSEGRDLDEYMGKEMTVGTVVHEAMRCDLTGKRFDASSYDLDEQQIEKVQRSIGAYHEWRKNNRLEVIASELPLVSASIDVGGTLDGGVVSVGGDVGILDLKTGALYPEALMQVAAYGMIWSELHPDQVVTAFHLLQVGKETGAFRHQWIPVSAMGPACEAFSHALALHGLRRRLEGLL